MDTVLIEIISRVARAFLWFYVYTQNARFKSMHVIEAKLRRHSVFQMSF